MGDERVAVGAEIHKSGPRVKKKKSLLRYFNVEVIFFHCCFYLLILDIFCFSISPSLPSCTFFCFGHFTVCLFFYCI